MRVRPPLVQAKAGERSGNGLFEHGVRSFCTETSDRLWRPVRVPAEQSKRASRED